MHNCVCFFLLQSSTSMKSLVCFFPSTPERKWRSCCLGLRTEKTATTCTTATGAAWRLFSDTRRSGSRPSSRKSIRSVPSCLTGRERTVPASKLCARRCAKSIVKTSLRAWCSAQLPPKQQPLL